MSALKKALETALLRDIATARERQARNTDGELYKKALFAANDALRPILMEFRESAYGFVYKHRTDVAHSLYKNEAEVAMITLTLEKKTGGYQVNYNWVVRANPGRFESKTLSGISCDINTFCETFGEAVAQWL